MSLGSVWRNILRHVILPRSTLRELTVDDATLFFLNELQSGRTNITIFINIHIWIPNKGFQYDLNIILCGNFVTFMEYISEFPET